MMGTQKKSDGNVLLSFLYFRVSGIKSELEFRQQRDQPETLTSPTPFPSFGHFCFHIHKHLKLPCANQAVFRKNALQNCSCKNI